MCFRLQVGDALQLEMGKVLQPGAAEIVNRHQAGAVGHRQIAQADILAITPEACEGERPVIDKPASRPLLEPATSMLPRVTLE
jgi:hypothetical protein